MTRHPLPQRRACETFPVRFWNQQFYVTVGFYPDGTPGEVFIDGGKSGQDVQATARDAAVVLSLALQHGTPLETIQHAISRDGRGNPTAIVGAIIDRIAGHIASEKPLEQAQNSEGTPPSAKPDGMARSQEEGKGATQ